MLPHLSFGATIKRHLVPPLLMLFNRPIRYFCKSRNIPNVKINKQLCYPPPQVNRQHNACSPLNDGVNLKKKMIPVFKFVPCECTNLCVKLVQYSKYVVHVASTVDAGGLAPVSISDKTSYRKISQSLEAARFVLRIVRSL